MFGAPGWMEMMMLGLLGMLIFGKRFPEVGRNVGKAISEFKKGLAGLEDRIDQEARAQQLGVQKSAAAMVPPAAIEQVHADMPVSYLPADSHIETQTPVDATATDSSADRG